jgi:hypothetical protein
MERPGQCGFQSQNQALPVNPSRKLRRFESFTRHTVHDKAPHQLKQPGGAFFVGLSQERLTHSSRQMSGKAWSNPSESALQSGGYSAECRSRRGAERLGCRDVPHHGEFNPKRRLRNAVDKRLPWVSAGAEGADNCRGTAGQLPRAGGVPSRELMRGRATGPPTGNCWGPIDSPARARPTGWTATEACRRIGRDGVRGAGGAGCRLSGPRVGLRSPAGRPAATARSARRGSRWRLSRRVPGGPARRPCLLP